MEEWSRRWEILQAEVVPADIRPTHKVPRMPPPGHLLQMAEKQIADPAYLPVVFSSTTETQSDITTLDLQKHPRSLDGDCSFA